jgi:HAMP domain-containing protein
MRAKFFRTKYLTGSPIQMMYLRLLMVSIIVPLVFVAGCLYYLIFTLMAAQLGIPEYIAYNLSPVLKKINMILLVGIPPLLVILLLWGIAVSHRFAGPLERLEEELKKITEKGDYRHRIHLRKNDDVRPIADAINKLLDKLEGRHR